MKTMNLLLIFLGKSLNLLALLLVEILCAVARVLMDIAENSSSSKPTYGVQTDPVLKSLYGGNTMLYHLHATQKWEDEHRDDADED